MDSVNRYREAVTRVLTELANFARSNGSVATETLFDRTQNRYVVVTLGWDGLRRIYSVLAHIEIINGKVWVQRDSTDIVIVRDLEEAGIPKSDIVLGFRHPDVRPLTDYAVA
jgi:XisI protein